MYSCYFKFVFRLKIANRKIPLNLQGYVLIQHIHTFTHITKNFLTTWTLQFTAHHWFFSARLITGSSLNGSSLNDSILSLRFMALYWLFNARLLAGPSLQNSLLHGLSLHGSSLRGWSLALHCMCSPHNTVPSHPLTMNESIVLNTRNYWYWITEGELFIKTCSISGVSSK